MYCPGQTPNFSCVTGEPVVWDGTLFAGQCPSNSPVADTIVLQGLTADNISDIFSCGPYNLVVDNVEVVSDPLPTTLVTSSLTVSADSSLNGSTVVCRTSGSGSNTQMIELLISGMCHFI